MSETVRFDLASETQTSALAAALAARARIGAIIALQGDLGAGKTAFARAFVRALTGPEEDVPSPTFTLVQLYDAPAFTIYHFDLYRLEDPDEVLELGIDDAFAGGVSLIEWPDRAGGYLPPAHLAVDIRIGEAEGTRTITFSGDGWTGRLEGLNLD